MTAEQALRFAAYQAAECRKLDEHEALCLLFPALLAATGLNPMNGYEAEEFHRDLRRRLQTHAQANA